MATPPHTAASDCALHAFVGCRTTAHRAARGVGIQVFAARSHGAWTHLHSVPAGENPSYLLVDDDRRALHCVHGDGTQLSSFRIERDGSLAPLESRNCAGSNPVHLAFSAGRDWLIVANYATGSLATLRTRDDGGLDPVAHRLDLPSRPGPHRTQQTGAHPHQVQLDPSGRWLVVPDKGGDAVHTVVVDERHGELWLAATCRVAPMSGPRHIVFSADGVRAWLVLELSSQVMSLGFDPAGGVLRAAGRTTTVPDAFVGENTAAGVALSNDERFLYVTNRGHGSVVRYQIDATSGALSRPAWRGTGGQTPRFITRSPRGDAFLVANEDTDSIVAVDATRLDVSQLTTTGSPVCIAFTSSPQGTP